jgi:hypothetical protein
LRKIRYRGAGNETEFLGWDWCRSNDDVLWASNEVKNLLKKRGKRSPSAERRARQAQSKLYYKKRRTQYKNMMEQNKLDLATGAVTESEAARWLGELGVGWYRWRWSITQLQQQLKDAQEHGDTAAVHEVTGQVGTYDCSKWSVRRGLHQDK